jgi:hypothetical protein
VGWDERKWGNSNEDRRPRTSSRANTPSVPNAIGRLRPPEKIGPPHKLAGVRELGWPKEGDLLSLSCGQSLRRQLKTIRKIGKTANGADLQKFDQNQTCWRRLCLNHILTILISPDRKTEVQLRMGSTQCRKSVKRTAAKRCTLPGLPVG